MRNGDDTNRVVHVEVKDEVREAPQDAAPVGRILVLGADARMLANTVNDSLNLAEKCYTKARSATFVKQLSRFEFLGRLLSENDGFHLS